MPPMPANSTPTSGLAKPLRIDARWFKERIAAYGTQATLAAAMRTRDGKPFDQASLSRLLSGRRLLQMHEARQMATILGVPMADVLRHAGINVRDDDLEDRYRKAVKMVGALLGVLDEHGVTVPARLRGQAEALS